MYIGIDGSRLTCTHPSGVERFSTNLISSLVTRLKHSNHRCIVYVRAKTNNIPHDVQHVIQRTRMWTHTGLGPTARTHGVDVLFVPSHVLPIIRPKHSVVYLHDTCFENAGYAYSLYQRWYLRVTAANAMKYAGVITHSEHTRTMLLNTYRLGAHSPVAVRPAPLTVPHSASSLPWSSKYPFLLVIGRVEIRKNIPVLLCAFDRLVSTHPNITHRLVIMGADGYGAKEIHQVHKNMQHKDRVLFTSYTSEELKYAAFRHTDGIVHPSLCEGWSFVLSEARAAGKPFACSDIPVCREAGENGIYVKRYKNVDSWSNALYSLIQNPTPPDPPESRTWDNVAKDCVDSIEKWYG